MRIADVERPYVNENPRAGLARWVASAEKF